MLLKIEFTMLFVEVVAEAFGLENVPDNVLHSLASRHGISIFNVVKKPRYSEIE